MARDYINGIKSHIFEHVHTPPTIRRHRRILAPIRIEQNHILTLASQRCTIHPRRFPVMDSLSQTVGNSEEEGVMLAHNHTHYQRGQKRGKSKDSLLHNIHNPPNPLQLPFHRNRNLRLTQTRRSLPSTSHRPIRLDHMNRFSICFR